MNPHELEQIEAEHEAIGETPRWAFRVDRDLKRAYLEACRADGVSGAERIRTHMQNVVDEHKGSNR